MTLHYKTYGSGHPLLILHGLFGSLNNWHTVGKKFAKHFTVYTIDQRNHGGSPHSSVMNYQVMAEDLNEFMQQHDISSAHILGHSMGGKTAMNFAIDFPGRVNSLIVVDIAPKAYPRSHDEILDALCALNLSTLSTREEIDELLSEKINSSAVRQFLLTNLKRDDSSKFAWKMNLQAICENYDEITKGLDTNSVFQKPTLFISGGRMGHIVKEDRPLIKMIFPLSRIVTIKHAGHWIHAEAPEEFVQIVLDFLTR